MTSSGSRQDVLPPLIGDGNGRYRVNIVGNSGVGKSTVANSLAVLLDVPYVSLDQLFWQPNWIQTPTDQFRTNVMRALDEHERGWVVDGSYKGIVSERATDIIWLDPPLILYFPRLCIRTFLRMISARPPCSPGCKETIQSVFFSKDSILLWCLTHHSVTRKRGEAMIRESMEGQGKIRRLGGWGYELSAWWASVETMVRSQAKTPA